MDKDNFFIKSQIFSNIDGVARLLSTGVFATEVLRPFQEPVFISVILKLDDLLQKFRILNQRISFTDDIGSGDITDLVNKIRNAICHLNSDENMLDGESKIKFVFNMIIGKSSNVIQIGQMATAASDYEDDIAFFYGEHRIYLRRHLVRLINESRSAYQNLYPNEQ